MKSLVETPPQGRLPFGYGDLVFVPSLSPRAPIQPAEIKGPPSPAVAEEVRAILGSVPAQALFACVLVLGVGFALGIEAPQRPSVIATMGDPVTTGSITLPLRPTLD